MKVIFATTAWIAVLSAGIAAILFLNAPAIHAIELTQAAQPSATQPQATQPQAAPVPAGDVAAPKRQEPVAPVVKTVTTAVHVIVIDPGHGGIDAGASTT